MRDGRELVLFRERHLRVLMPDPYDFDDALADEVDHLEDAHEDAERAGDDHEQHEDLLLCWTTDEAVNGVGARLYRALGQPENE